MRIGYKNLNDVHSLLLRILHLNIIKKKFYFEKKNWVKLEKCWKKQVFILLFIETLSWFDFNMEVPLFSICEYGCVNTCISYSYIEIWAF